MVRSTRLTVVGPSRTDAGPGVRHPLLGAIEILPGHVESALIDSSGRVVARESGSYPSDTGLSDITQAIVATVSRCFGQTKPRGIGVAAGGLIDAQTGTISEMNDVPALHGFPIAEFISSKFAADTFVEHRARLQVLGDRWFGWGRGESSFASVSTGETLGVGILYQGKVLAPNGGRSGAHMTVAVGGEKCSCGELGCWKTLATAHWFRRRAAELGFEPDVSLAEVARAAESGTTVAAGLIQHYAENVSLGLVNIQQLCAPGLFILHGEAKEGGELFRAAIEDRLRAVDSWTSSPQPPRVQIARIADDDVALLGGAALVLSEGLQH